MKEAESIKGRRHTIKNTSREASSYVSTIEYLVKWKDCSE